VSEAPRLFRDFVEKLERAYIAFDGVVGSCLGRAWGGTNHGAGRPTTLTLFRKTRNPISRNAPHSFLPSLSLSLSLFGLSIGSLPGSYAFFFPDIFPVYSTRVAPPFSFICIQSFNSSFVEKERERAERWFLIWARDLSFFLSLSCYRSFSISRSSFRVVSIVRWANAYSKQRQICRYSELAKTREIGCVFERIRHRWGKASCLQRSWIMK